MVNAEGFVFSAAGKDKPPDKSNISFKDMLIGPQEVQQPRNKVDLLKENLARIEYHDNNPLLPMVHIDEKVFDGLCAPWQEALVVKLLGKNIGYHTMKDRLKKVWKPVSGFDIMDIGNNFYMVKFDSEIDRSKVMYDGPWMIFDHYLTVQCWSKDFVSPTAKIDRTMVWIRFPGLNLFYYDESILLALAAAIGKPVKVDSNTLDVKRGRFARVCVEIDLTKPVIGKVWLRNHWYHVEYEGLHRICATCGYYGHLTRDCSQKPAQQQASMTAPAAEGAEVADTRVNLNPNEAVTDAQLVGKKTSQLEKTKEQIHGDWMVVQRKSRKSLSQHLNSNGQPLNDKKNVGKKNKGNNGSTSKPRAVVQPKIISQQKNTADLAYIKKDIPPTNNKRHRSDSEFFPSPSEVSEPVLLQNPSGINKGNNIYDIGHGNKPKMKAISPNRFLLLREDMEETNNQENGSNNDNIAENNSSMHDDVGVEVNFVVPETQSDAMAL